MGMGPMPRASCGKQPSDASHVTSSTLMPEASCGKHQVCDVEQELCRHLPDRDVLTLPADDLPKHSSIPIISNAAAAQHLSGHAFGQASMLSLVLPLVLCHYVSSSDRPVLGCRACMLTRWRT